MSRRLLAGLLIFAMCVPFFGPAAQVEAAALAVPAKVEAHSFGTSVTVDWEYTYSPSVLTTLTFEVWRLAGIMWVSAGDGHLSDEDAHDRWSDDRRTRVSSQGGADHDHYHRLSTHTHHDHDAKRLVGGCLRLGADCPGRRGRGARQQRHGHQDQVDRTRSTRYALPGPEDQRCAHEGSCRPRRAPHRQFMGGQ